MRKSSINEFWNKSHVENFILFLSNALKLIDSLSSTLSNNCFLIFHTCFLVGGPDPAHNVRLATAMENAQKSMYLHFIF